MNLPVGGLTTIFHFVVIFLYRKSKAFVSLLTILVVLMASAIGLYGMVNLGIGDDSNYAYLKEHLTFCQAAKIDENKPMVVLRVDDVQSFTWEEVTKRMVVDARERNMPLTLGVIPAGLDEDKSLTGFLRSQRCFLEFAQHGWNHQAEPPEFLDLDKEEASARISMGKRLLEEIIGGPVESFIPPANKYSMGTKEALKESGFLVVSGEGEEMFDYDVSVYDWESLESIPVDKVIEEVKESINEKGYSIIMLHPQDYSHGQSLDMEKYSQYLKLLEGLTAENVSVVTLRGLWDRVRQSGG